MMIGAINIAGVTLLGIFVVFILFVTFLAFVSRYKKCPSDRVMVIYGKTSGQQAARCIHGGAKFIWPIWQDYGYISLRPMQIEVNLNNALCKQNIRINVPSVFTVGVSTDPAIMGNAAERLFGQSSEQISELAKDIIFGQLRLVIASMTIEAINTDRESFLKNIEQNVADELNKIGLQLLNVNITDITDESGYIDAIGKRAAAEAINQAKVDVAEEEKKGGIGEAEAKKMQRISVSKAEADAQAGEANADRDKRIAIKQADARAVEGENISAIEIAKSNALAVNQSKVAVAEEEKNGAIGEAEARKQQRISIAAAEAEAQAGEAMADRDKRIAIKQADARAVEGENISAIEIAKSNALRIEQEAEAFRKAEAAKKVADAQIEKAQFEAEQAAQAARAEMEKEKQRADIIVPATIHKQQVEIMAEAEAEKLRREAKGEADAIFAKLDAEARGNYEILKAKGQGFNEIIDSCKGDTDAAAKMFLIEKLEQIVEMQTEAIKNIKIDKITVWDGGSKGTDGKTSTAGFLSGMMQCLPPLHDVANMAGIDLPGYLGQVKNQTPEQVADAKAAQNKDKK